MVAGLVMALITVALPAAADGQEAVRAAQSAESPAATTAGSASPRSVWSGVYTAAQARRGEDLYLTHCAGCHGESLEGNGPATALSGLGFSANWDGRSMGDMLDRARTTMPPNKPGTLSRQQVADVLAFVLRVNRFPPGDAELPRQAESLAQIRFLATKP
jgi:mono/diheme cytochrome c family protein